MMGFERYFNINLEEIEHPIANRYLVDTQMLSKSMSGTVTKLAFDLKEKRTVVFKTVQPNSTKLSLFSEKIRMEAVAISKFDHFALPKILDLFNEEDTGLPVIVMNDIEGRLLLEGMGKTPLSQMVRITEDLAAGIDYAANKNIHSGDIWEGNILVLHDKAKM